MELYKKHRPASLDYFEGNTDMVASFREILERDKEDIPHAHLFTGPSGCGKTTLARIFASAVGCADCDFTEVDSADFRGIDTIRDIRSQMNLMPMGGDVQVWLLDECHMLSGPAQEALLKALEDTPKRVFFLLATTVPQKLLKTIRNRCTPFEVQPLTDKRMYRLLKRVSKVEELDIPEPVLERIIADSLGSSRMALVILDKVRGLPQAKMLKAAESAAAAENEVIELCRALIRGDDWKKIAAILKGLDADPENIRRVVLGYCQSCLLGGRGDAYDLMDCFREPTYNIGMPGITMACWEAAHPEE